MSRDKKLDGTVRLTGHHENGDKSQLRQQENINDKFVKEYSKLASFLFSMNASTTLNKPCKIMLKSATRIDVVHVNEIIYCSAAGGYAEVFLYDRSIVITQPMGTFYKRLEGYSFFKINKSYFINLNHFHSYRKDKEQVILLDGVALKVARRRKPNLIRQLRKTLLT